MLFDQMRRLYGAATNELSYIVHDWDRFVAEAPKSDDVREYIRENPMHVPLYDFLFSPVPLSAERAEAVLHRVDFSEAEDLEEVRATGSIIWDGKSSYTFITICQVPNSKCFIMRYYIIEPTRWPTTCY
jgi:hypothetical protein